MKKILITGSNGRVGKDISRILEKEYEIIRFNSKDKLSPIYFNKIDTVIHLAALTPRKDKIYSLQEYIDVNVKLTKDILNFALQNDINKVIIPTSWSWSFKAGKYQFSKLLQEKVALEFKKNGLNVVLIEFPEVIHEGYNGAIEKILSKIEFNEKTIVDSISIKILKTEDIAQIFKLYIENKDSFAIEHYNRCTKSINLYQYIKSKVNKNDSTKIEFLSEGNKKIRTIGLSEDKTLIFPDMEVEE